MNRVNVTLDDDHAAKLTAMATRIHVNEGTLARSLLSSALDAADPDPTHIAALLNGVPGMRTRLDHARAQAQAGDVIALDDL
ncbi:MAG: hypothetical protein QM679_03355 [Patulibacter sp.]